MASNNRKPPQQSSVPKGGGGWRKYPASHQSSISSHQKDAHKRTVHDTLKDMFINVFDGEIIQSVAQNCNWKLNKSIETLIMLADGHDNPSPENLQNKFKQSSVNRTFNNKKHFSNKASSNFPQLPNKKRVTMGEGSRAVKVAYRGINQLNSSDDDADVVIEEENEFEIVGNGSPIGVGPSNFPGSSFPPVGQFLTPPMPCIPQKASDKVAHLPVMAFVQKKQNSNVTSSTGREKVNTFGTVKMVNKRVKPLTGTERIKKLIMDGTKVMVLMRGCPGSGKSFLAKQIVQWTVGGHYNKYVFSTDNFFEQLGGGQYTFVPARLPEAHSWNQSRVLAEVKRGTNPVVVDNTNLEAWEMQPYAMVAVRYGYTLELLEPSTAWRYNPLELSRRNTHGIHRKRIRDMLDRFDRDLTGDKLLKLFKLEYAQINRPPWLAQKRDPTIAPSKRSRKDVENISRRNTNTKATSVAQTTDLTEALAVFFAEKIPERGQPLRLENGRTMHEVFSDMCSLESQDSYKMEPSSHMVDKIQDLTLGSQKETEMVTSTVSSSDESSPCSDTSNECESDEDEYQSDEDSSEKTELCEGDKSHFSIDEAENKCMEYVLVLEDNSFLFQKSHDVVKVSDNLICGPPDSYGRCWEHIVSSEESKKLFLEDESAEMATMIKEDATESPVVVVQNSEDVLMNALESFINFVSQQGNPDEKACELHTSLIVENTEEVFDITELPKNSPGGKENADMIALDVKESDKNLDLMMESSDKVITDLHNTLKVALDAEDSDRTFLVPLENIYTTLNELKVEDNLITSLHSAEDSSVDVLESFKNSEFGSGNIDLMVPIKMEPKENALINNCSALENNSNASLPNLDPELCSSTLMRSIESIGSLSTESKLELEIGQNKMNIIESQDGSAVQAISSDAIDQWLKSLDPNEKFEEMVKVPNISVDLTQEKCEIINSISNIEIQDTAEYLRHNKCDDISVGASMEIQEMRVQDATSAEEEYESAISSSLSDGDEDDAHGKNIIDGTNSKIEIEFQGMKEVPKVNFLSWITHHNTERTTGVVHVDHSGTTNDSRDQHYTSENSTTDTILQEWEQGKLWDDVEPEQVHIAVGDSTLKPARRQRHQPVVNSSHDTVQEVRKDSESLPPELEAWSTVAEPFVSWEEKDDHAPAHEPKVPTAPQPQRLLFAAGPSLASSVQVFDNGHADSVDVVSIEGNVNQSPLISGSECADGIKYMFISENEGNYTNSELWNATSSTEETNTSMQEILTNSSTNTNHSDFELLSAANESSSAEVPPEVYVVRTRSRSISEGLSASAPRMLPRVLMLDKSSMTLPVEEMSHADVRLQFRELTHIFPSIAVDNLMEIFKKCNMDLNWTVDVILESQLGELERVAVERIGNLETDLGADEAGSTSSNFGAINEGAVVSPVFGVEQNVQELEQLLVDSVLHSDCSSQSLSEANNIKYLSPSKRTFKKDRNAPISELSLQLKKQLEENVVISDQHYSEHTLRIRNIRHGEVVNTEKSPGVCVENVCGPDLQANCSDEEEEAAAIGLDMECTDSSFEEEEETLPLALDRNFIDSLHQLFGSTRQPFKQDLSTTVNLPLSLARQIHCYLMEAQQSAYELMMQEDEDLARQLQQQEQECLPAKVPDLREIMDMEMALALYKLDQSQWHSQTKDDLATKLSKQLLCETFPKLPRDVLMEVFQAHSNSFADTIEVLLASTGQNEDSVRTVMAPEACAAHEQALLEKAKQESLKYSHVLAPPARSTPLEDNLTQEQAFEDANYYRSEASRHYQLHNECHRKAQDAYRNGLIPVASYYSQVASLHKQRIDDSNARAASSLLLAHSLGRISTTLDLHFLYVAEALQVLDMFLDYHIQKLNDGAGTGRSEILFVITGRGLRSLGGRSRIRPAVTCRLQQRGLKFVAVNPGLLKVSVTKHISLSSCAN